MVNINILSDDILYARMLMHELRSTYGTENENLNTTINGLTQNESYISVVDLDSKYVSESFNSPYIIGFTTYESIKVSKKYPRDLCTFSTLIHRVVRISSYLWALNYKDNENDEKTQDNGAEPYDGGRIQASGKASAGGGARRSA